MKKILSMMLVVMMLVGMLPMNAIHSHAAELSETITIAASTGTVSGESISWSSGSLSFTANKNTSSTAIRTTDSDHFRLYVGFSATLNCSAGNITKIVMTSTGSSYAIAPTGKDGSVGTVSGTTITIVPNGSSNTYTIPSITKQTRIKSITVTYSTVDSGECAHTNTEAIEAVAATCTTAGNTAGVKCTDCGAILEGNETIAALGHTNDEGVVTAPTCTTDGYTLYTCTVCGSTKKDDYVDATGHNYVDGVCSVCSTAMPTGLNGKYYIAAIRSSGNYMYMSNDLGTASTKRYQEVDSGLTELPASITAPADTQVFELIFDASTATYKIKSGDQYLGWTSGNSGALVDEASAITATIENSAVEGAYLIHFAASDAERYLALNSNAANKYFAWYKQGQAENLYLIPVVESEACAHANTTTETVAATCTEAGSETVTCADCGEVVSTTVLEALGHSFVNDVCTVCGAEFEGEIDTPDPSEPAEGGYEMATEIVVGDSIIIVSKDAGMELGSFSTTSTVYGVGTAYTDVPAGIMTWTVEEGTVAGSYAFKNTDGNYLYWSSGNSLKANATKDAQASWKVSFDGNDVILVNAGTVDVARHVAWNSSSPRFANYKDSSISGYNTYYTIQFFKYVSGTACTHSWGEWVVTTAPTCTETGIETATCTLCGASKTQSVAATGHSFVYTETAITCANCDYSAAYTLSPISEAKAYTDTSLVYYVKGVVTYVNNDKVYIEDSTGALLVMFDGNVDTSAIALGDEILVWDCLTTYNGLIETTYTLASEYVKVSTGNALPSQTVTIADLLADTTNEYLSERVVIENVTVGTINTSGNTALTDADGNSINIYKVSGLSEDINENDKVTVTAILSTYNGYQLLINPGTAATDVVETVAGEEEVVTTVTIAEAKAGTAGEYYQVEGTVTYISGRNVYIQDATGGIVVYLAANAATTQVGDNVKAYGALKVYNGLIELDAVDETNAEFYSILSSGNSVEAQAVTIEGLLADTTNEYLAEKVTLSNVYVSHYSYNNTYKNVNYTLVDGNGNSIEIYRVSVASEEECIAGGSIVNVEAVVGTFNGYQLLTTNDKIVVTGTCAHETTELVNYADATCTEAGYTGDTMCTVCENYVARGEEIPAHATETHAAVEATCTAVGYTEGVFCTVCQIYISGHEEIPMVDHLIIGDIIEPTCTEQGYTRYYCVNCGMEDEISDFISARGHDVEGIHTLPTCTEQGYTTYVCKVCGITESVGGYIPALGHSYVDGKCEVCGEADPGNADCEHEYEAEITYATTTAGGYTTYTCSKCGDSYQDNFTNPLPRNLRFASAYLSLESDLSVTFQVRSEVLADYENVRLVFTLGDTGHVVEMTEEEYFNGQSGRPSFKFTGVAPRHVNTTIYATLYGTIEGVEHTYTMEYSAAKYCYTTLRAAGTAEKLKTLIVDLLNYGAAHQVYGKTNLDNLATYDLTDAEKALGTSTVPAMTSYMAVKYVEHAAPTARFNNAALYLEDAVTIRCKLTLNDGVDINNVTVQVTDDDGNEWIVLGEELTHDSGNVYYLNFKALSAQQMRKIVYITICENGVAISHTLRYSIESYAATGYPSAAGTALGDVILAMIRYGDSAKAYFENK